MFIDAVVIHTSASGSYTSTVFTAAAPIDRPPMAYSRPATTATPWPDRGVGSGALDVHWFRTGSYEATVLSGVPPGDDAAPPTTYSSPLSAEVPWASRPGDSDAMFFHTPRPRGIGLVYASSPFLNVPRAENRCVWDG